MKMYYVSVPKHETKHYFKTPEQRDMVRDYYLSYLGGYQGNEIEVGAEETSEEESTPSDWI